MADEVQGSNHVVVALSVAVVAVLIAGLQTVHKIKETN